MKPATTFIIVFLFGLLVSFNAYGFEVTALVDKNQISRDDSILLRVEVRGGKARLDLSQIKDFKVIPRGSSSLTRIINGKIEKKITHQYVLIPLSEGDLKIAPITAISKGKTALTDPIKIKVAKIIEDPDAAEKIFAKAQVVQSDLFVGQQTVYSLKFYTSLRLSGLGFENPPKFNHSFAKPFENEKTTTQRINGVLYQVTQVDYVVIPSIAGTLTIDPVVLVANVIVKTNQAPRFDSFFNDSFFSNQRTKPVRVSSNPVTLTVSSLPLYGGGSGGETFSGLIGRFEVESHVDKYRLKAGESLTWTIKISGSGNIMDTGPPKTVLVENQFKVYDDNPTESIRLTSTGYQGFKLFKKAVVPINPGKFTLPSVKLTYFDVEKKNYHTIVSPPIALDVIPSEKMRVAIAKLPENKDLAPVKQEVSMINKDILEIREGLEVLEEYKQMRPLYFGIWVLIPGFLFAGLKLFILVQKKEVSVEKQMELKAKFYLKQAAKSNIKEDTFLSHLYSALVSMILSKGKRQAETITLGETKEILTSANVTRDDMIKVTDLLESIESGRFGQKTIDQIQANALLNKAKQVMKLLAVSIFVLGISTLIPKTLLATPSTHYFEAVKNYKAGEFKKAAEKFEAIAKTPINNPYLFYNIGNAYLKSGDIGHAVVWYERAKRLAPNDPDLKFNLAYANSQIKDKSEEAVNMMDVLFFWDNLIQIKYLQLGTIFLAFLFFSWAGFRTIKQQPVLSGTGILICAVFLLTTTITGISMVKQTAQLHAIIIEDKIDVRSGVLNNATRLFALHAGTRVRVEEKRDKYLKIFFAKDKVGWIRASVAEII
ncbi:MAG: BatD family protein [Desulfobacula sp.]|nr:BatD family protein [Desulfobacula sp.]